MGEENNFQPPKTMALKDKIMNIKLFQSSCNSAEGEVKSFIKLIKDVRDGKYKSEIYSIRHTPIKDAYWDRYLPSYTPTGVLAENIWISPKTALFVFEVIYTSTKARLDTRNELMEESWVYAIYDNPSGYGFYVFAYSYIMNDAEYENANSNFQAFVGREVTRTVFTKGYGHVRQIDFRFFASADENAYYNKDAGPLIGLSESPSSKNQKENSNPVF
jgi:hypothetical protein